MFVYQSESKWKYKNCNIKTPTSKYQVPTAGYQSRGLLKNCWLHFSFVEEQGQQENPEITSLKKKNNSQINMAKALCKHILFRNHHSYVYLISRISRMHDLRF